MFLDNNFQQGYDLKMADGGYLVARITYNFRTDESSRQWIQDRLSRGILVLKFLKSINQELPVPRVHAWDFNVDDSVNAPFSIMDRLYGEDKWLVWPKFTPEEKVACFLLFSFSALTPSPLHSDKLCSITS